MFSLIQGGSQQRPLGSGGQGFLDGGTPCCSHLLTLGLFPGSPSSTFIQGHGLVHGRTTWEHRSNCLYCPVTMLFGLLKTRRPFHLEQRLQQRQDDSGRSMCQTAAGVSESPPGKLISSLHCHALSLHPQESPVSVKLEVTFTNVRKQVTRACTGQVHRDSPVLVGTPQLRLPYPTRLADVGAAGCPL